MSHDDQHVVVSIHIAGTISIPQLLCQVQLTCSAPFVAHRDPGRQACLLEADSAFCAGSFVNSQSCFCKDGYLKRPTGLCFDDAGDLYVTSLTGEVRLLPLSFEHLMG
jgi:hypothetical protein